MNAVIELAPALAQEERRQQKAYSYSPSQSHNFGYYLRAAVIAVALGWIYLALPDGTHWAFLAVPMGLLALREAWRSIELACVSYRFDSGERIVWSSGVLSRSTGSLEIFRIQNVTLHQSLFERLAGAGTILLETQDPTNPFVRLIGVRKPEELREWLTAYVQRARRARGLQEVVVS